MNTQLVRFTSKLCKENRHVNCSKQWEGLGFIALCDCICHEKKDDIGSDVSGNVNIIH